MLRGDDMGPILGPFRGRSGRIERQQGHLARSEVDEATYHVVLDGRSVGPYDRRTILGMRIKHMLTGDHLLVTSGGARLTVRELIGASGEAAADGGDSARDVRGSAGTSTGMLVMAGRRGFRIPKFIGEVEVRVQGDVLRIAGRHRRAFRWHDGRVKLPLADVVHARAKGPRADIWLQPAGASALQHVALYMFTSEAADELAARLAPKGAAHPALAAAQAAAAGDAALSSLRVLGVAAGAVVLVIGLVLLVLLYRRV
jgi:hypothetical protein